MEKHDAKKPRLGLVVLGFARALQAVGEVATFGAEKYTDNGWVDVPDGERRYTDAMLRHLLREAQGEAKDPESGLAHAAHVAWNALARLDLELRAADGERHFPPDHVGFGCRNEARLPDGWVAWRGGECPVDPDAIVDIRTAFEPDIPGRDIARRLRWDWGYEGAKGGDIIAYRVVGEFDEELEARATRQDQWAGRYRKD